MPAEPRLFDLSFIKPFVTTEDRVPLKITLTGGGDLAVKELLTEMLAEFGGRGPFFDILLKANLLKSLAIVNREHAEQGKHTAVTAGAPVPGAHIGIRSIYSRPLRPASMAGGSLCADDDVPNELLPAVQGGDRLDLQPVLGQLSDTDGYATADGARADGNRCMLQGRV